MDELSRKFGITPIARDGKILFVKDNSPLRKEYIITPSDITRISWADESAKCPSGVSVPYRHPLHYTTLFYTAGNKCAALKVNDFQSSEEDAKRLAENLLREYQSKQYNIALELAKMRCDIKAGSKIKISGLKKSIDKTYILTDVTTSISNKKSVTKLQGIYLNV